MPQEDNNGKTMDLDDFLDNHGNSVNEKEPEKTSSVENTQEINSNTSDDNKKDETKTTEKQNSKSDKGEKLYTQDELNDIITRRLARFKFDAVEHGVDEKTKDLTERLKVLEDERNNAIREAQVLKLSKETGIDADVLIQTQLEGEALTNFANTLKEKSSSWNLKTADLENAVLNNAPKSNWEDDLARQILGDK